MKTKKCDFCGKEFTGPNYNVYDENFNLQKGVNRCANCFHEDLLSAENEYIETNK